MALVDTSFARVIIQAFYGGVCLGEFTCLAVTMVRDKDAERSSDTMTVGSSIVSLRRFIKEHNQEGESSFTCSISVPGLGVVWCRSVGASEVESSVLGTAQYKFLCDVDRDYTFRPAAFT